MKSLFFLCVLIVFFPILTFSQNVKPNSNHTDLDLYFFRQTDELLPYYKSSPSHDELNKISRSFLKRQQVKKQTGINANGRFEPVKVLIDSTFRYTSMYDSRGNRVSYVYEILQNGNWIIRTKNTYTFDGKNNLINNVQEMWFVDNSRDVSKSTFTYDENGKILSETRQILQNSVWVNMYRTLNTYDNYGNCKITTNSSWINGTWEDYTKNLYTYDNNNNMLTVTWESIHGGVWKAGGRNTFAYDNYGNLVSLLVESGSDTGFVKTDLFTISYDQNDRLLKTSYEMWEHGVIRRGYEDAYTYDLAGKLLTFHSKQRNGGQWTDTDRKFYSYDNSGALVSELYQLWQNGDWVNKDSLAYTYDSNGNAVMGEAFKWDNTWLPGYMYIDFSYNEGKDHVFYGGETVNIEYELVEDNDPALVQEFNLLQNYPNPFNSSTTIKYSLKKEGSVKITVFDILGNRVAVPVDKYKPAGTYYVNFDGSHLPSGVYFYMLESGGIATTKKLILMK